MEFSPFEKNLLGLSAAMLYGVTEYGKQFVLKLEGNRLEVVTAFEVKDGVYDCAWSEHNRNHLVFACGDGTAVLGDITSGKILQEFKEHTAEVYSVDWNLVGKVVENGGIG